jgi:RNA polymerase sigma factor (sigma-70 family)
VTDLELLHLLRTGNTALENKALDVLYKRNRVRITSYTCRNHGSQEEATELLQDCLVAVFFNAKKDGFELTAKWDTYFFAVARNLWLKKLRSKRREVTLVDWPLGLDLPGAEVPDALLSEERGPLLRLLDQISLRCREVLTMIYVDELGIKEIKELLGYTSDQGVRNKKSECLGRLRDLYDSKKMDVNDD